MIVGGLRTPFVKAFAEFMKLDTIALGGKATAALLTKLNLSQYSTIVFGSNNADYTPGGSSAIVNALTSYVFAGGAALFISDANFGKSYGMLIEELKLLARGVIVLDKDGKVVYAETVKEVASEPNYDAALAALKSVAA